VITINPLKQKIITFCGWDMDILWIQNLSFNSNSLITLTKYSMIYGLTKCKARRKFIFDVKKIPKDIEKFQDHHHITK